MDHGGPGHHTAAMGPHPRQQSMQQSTNIICNGSTLLKLEKKLFITSIMTGGSGRTGKGLVPSPVLDIPNAY